MVVSCVFCGHSILVIFAVHHRPDSEDRWPCHRSLRIMSRFVTNRVDNASARWRIGVARLVD